MAWGSRQGILGVFGPLELAWMPWSQAALLPSGLVDPSSMFPGRVCGGEAVGPRPVGSREGAAGLVSIS